MKQRAIIMVNTSHQHTVNGPRKLIAGMKGRGKYVHPLINLIVFMGQSTYLHWLDNESLEQSHSLQPI